jgi:nitrilase
VQIAPDFERRRHAHKVCEAIAEAAAQGVQLIVFPETFVPYYPYFSFVKPPVQMGAEHLRLYERAVVVPGPVTDAVAQRARAHGMVVVLGVNERDHGSLYNTQLIFDADGTLAAQAPQDHADLPRAHDLGPGRRQRPEGRRHRVGRSARWPAGSTTTRSPATR